MMKRVKRICMGIGGLLMMITAAACEGPVQNTTDVTVAETTNAVTASEDTTEDAETKAAETNPSSESTNARSDEQLDAHSGYTELLDWYYHQISAGWSDYDETDAAAYGVVTGDGTDRIVSYLWYLYDKPDLSHSGYQFMDINHDGVDELVVGVTIENADSDALYDLYTVCDGKPVRLLSSGERDFFSVGDGVICESGSGGAALHMNTTYHLTDGKAVPFEEYKYDGMEDEENPYFYSNEPVPAEWGGYEFQNWKHITEEELQQCGNYEIYDLHLQLFSDYTPD